MFYLIWPVSTCTLFSVHMWVHMPQWYLSTELLCILFCNWPLWQECDFWLLVIVHVLCIASSARLPEAVMVSAQFKLFFSVYPLSFSLTYLICSSLSSTNLPLPFPHQLALHPPPPPPLPLLLIAFVTLQLSSITNSAPTRLCIKRWIIHDGWRVVPD